jgi:hypothetical protein
MSWAETSKEQLCISGALIPGILPYPPRNFLPAACKSSCIAFSRFVWLRYWQRLRCLLSPIKYIAAFGPNRGRLDLVWKEKCYV